MHEYQPRNTDDIDREFFDQNPHRAMYLREPTVQEICDRVGDGVDAMRLAVVVIHCRDRTGRLWFLRDFLVAPKGFVQSRRFTRLQKRFAKAEPELVSKMRQQLTAMTELRRHPQIH
jgi:hypothetical protein